MKRTFLAVGMLLACHAPALGASFAEGEYSDEHGSNCLTLTSDGSGGFSFEATSVGANGHNCLAEGALKKGETKSTLQGTDESHPCILKFIADGKSITLDASDGCSVHCGARAVLGGRMIRVPPECTADSISRRHSEYLARYKEKKYNEAKLGNLSLKKECAWFLSEAMLDEMTNDLAITLHHLNDDPGCLKTLEPFKERAAQTDEQIREDWASEPAYGQALIRTARAARTNLKICGGLKK